MHLEQVSLPRAGAASVARPKIWERASCSSWFEEAVGGSGCGSTVSFLGIVFGLVNALHTRVSDGRMRDSVWLTMDKYCV